MPNSLKLKANLVWAVVDVETENAAEFVRILETLKGMPHGAVNVETVTDATVSVILDQGWVWDAVDETIQDAVAKRANGELGEKDGEVWAARDKLISDAVLKIDKIERRLESIEAGSDDFQTKRATSPAPYVSDFVPEAADIPLEPKGPTSDEDAAAAEARKEKFASIAREVGRSHLARAMGKNDSWVNNRMPGGNCKVTSQQLAEAESARRKIVGAEGATPAAKTVPVVEITAEEASKAKVSPDVHVPPSPPKPAEVPRGNKAYRPTGVSDVVDIVVQLSKGVPAETVAKKWPVPGGPSALDVEAVGEYLSMAVDEMKAANGNAVAIAQATRKLQVHLQRQFGSGQLWF